MEGEKCDSDFSRAISENIDCIIVLKLECTCTEAKYPYKDIIGIY